MEFKASIVQNKQNKRKAKPLYFIATLLVIIALAMPFLFYEFITVPAQQLNTKADLSLPQQETRDDTNTETRLVSIDIKSGDTIDSLLQSQGIDEATITQLQHESKFSDYLQRLHPHQTLKLVFDEDHELTSLALSINLQKNLIFERNSKGFRGKFLPRALESRLEYATATVKYSVTAAGLQRKIPYKILRQLTTIFHAKLDFDKDIRAGDKFMVLYNDYYVGDKKIRTGDIIAAEFINRGDTYKAVRYTDENGYTAYFDPQGKNLRKAFTRYPVKFTHISSRFNLRRRHPILRVARPHRGVDLAAPLGTPIHAASGGRIKSIGREGGYGRVVRIQHNKEIMTLYAHMLRFRKDLKRGSKVKKDEVIGYVGQSGLATGPHLHFEFRRNKRPLNPVTVKLPDARSLRSPYLNLFKAEARNLLSQLELYASAQYAAASTD